MKKQISVLLAITLTTVCFAASKTEGPGFLSKETRIHSAIKKIVIRGSVDIVLFEDSSKVLITEGKQKNVESVVIKEDNGVLSITNNSGRRAIIYLPVKQLEMIEAYGTSRISSCTILESALLTLSANDCSIIAVKATGKIIVRETGDTELQVERTELHLSIPTNS